MCIIADRKKAAWFLQFPPLSLVAPSKKHCSCKLNLSLAYYILTTTLKTHPSDSLLLQHWAEASQFCALSMCGNSSEDKTKTLGSQDYPE